MTSTDLVAGVVDRAKAKIDATHQATMLFVPRILDAYRKAQDADKQGFNQSLAANIALGKELTEAKDAATKGKLRWKDWRAERIPQITQTKASLCMRLYRGEDLLLKPDRATDDGKRISDGVATALADGRMTVRKAAALLVTPTRTNPPVARRTNETVGKEWLKGLDADEVVIWLRELHGVEWLKGLGVALAKALEPAGPTSTGVRRV